MVNISSYMSRIGRKGGKARSKKKIAAGRRNVEKARAVLAELRRTTMKTIIVVGVLLSFTVVAKADGIFSGGKESPSVALDVNHQELSGAGSNQVLWGTPNLPFTQVIHDSITSNSKTDSFTPSIRMPLTNNLTVDLHYTYSQTTESFMGQVTNMGYTLNGSAFGIQVRYYLENY